MNDLIRAISFWFWDYYLLATDLLAVLCLAVKLVDQPARRMAIHWSSAAGLVVLGVFCALPDWSKLNLTCEPKRPHFYAEHEFSGQPTKSS